MTKLFAVLLVTIFFSNVLYCQSANSTASTRSVANHEIEGVYTGLISMDEKSFPGIEMLRGKYMFSIFERNVLLPETAESAKFNSVPAYIIIKEYDADVLIEGVINKMYVLSLNEGLIWRLRRTIDMKPNQFLFEQGTIKDNKVTYGTITVLVERLPPDQIK